MPRDPDFADPIHLVAHGLGGAPARLRPAPSRREWMDESPGGFANRCLPLTIANAHGWEVLGDCSFEAQWNGGQRPADVQIRALDNGRDLPLAHFGAGVLTFHIPVLFRTPPGISLWVGGTPNRPKDGIQPLTGIVETDWSPATFTMNWRFTRPHHVVRFERGEPVCFLFPIPRDLIARTVPDVRPLAEDPELEAAHRAWAEARGSFNEELRRPGSEARSAGWQRSYHLGRIGALSAEDHVTRSAPRPFPDHG